MLGLGTVVAVAVDAALVRTRGSRDDATARSMELVGAGALATVYRRYGLRESDAVIPQAARSRPGWAEIAAMRRAMSVFETERLVVRPWTHSQSDEARLHDMYSRWEVARWLGSTPKTLESRDQAAGVIDRWAARADGPVGIWAVEVRESGTVAGTVLLVPLPEGDGEMGQVASAPDSWGRATLPRPREAIPRLAMAGDLRRQSASNRRLKVSAVDAPRSSADRWYSVEVRSAPADRQEE
jgi:hypothetical protein